MAISVLHNPSHNKLRRLLQVEPGSLPQSLRVRRGVTGDLLRAGSSPLLRLVQQRLSFFLGVSARLL